MRVGVEWRREMREECARNRPNDVEVAVRGVLERGRKQRLVGLRVSVPQLWHRHRIGSDRTIRDAYHDMECAGTQANAPIVMLAPAKRTARNGANAVRECTQGREWYETGARVAREGYECGTGAARTSLAAQSDRNSSVLYGSPRGRPPARRMGDAPRDESSVTRTQTGEKSQKSTRRGHLSVQNTKQYDGDWRAARDRP